MMAEATQVVDIAGQSVVIAYDAEAGVWYVHSSTVPGLAGEAASAAELIEELQVTVRTLSLP
jgi:predicted RNase H-like HicB family nuclease